MIDWWLFLTPVLVLSVVLLLGFAGCSFEAVVLGDLTLRARVPTTLTVRRITFRWTPPGETRQELVLTTPSPVRTDGADGLYEHTLSQASFGHWEVECRVQVREGTADGDDTATGDFDLDESNFTPVPAAPFQAAGSPLGGTFSVTFTGLVPAVPA